MGNSNLSVNSSTPNLQVFPISTQRLTMHAMKFTSMEPKNQFYHANGGGRDSYITWDNGGSTCKKPNPQGLMIRPTFRSNHVPLMNRTMVRPRQDAKVVSYQPDGSGRDNYVVTDAGGLKNVAMHHTT